MRKGRSDDVRCVVVNLWKVSHVSPQFLKKYLGDPRPRSPARGHQSLMGEICWRRANLRYRMVSPCRKLDEGCHWSVWSLCVLRDSMAFYGFCLSGPNQSNQMVMYCKLDRHRWWPWWISSQTVAWKKWTWHLGPLNMGIYHHIASYGTDRSLIDHC